MFSWQHGLRREQKKPAPATSIQTLRTTDCQPWHSAAIVCTALFNKFLLAHSSSAHPFIEKEGKKSAENVPVPSVLTVVHKDHVVRPPLKEERGAEMNTLCSDPFFYLVLSPVLAPGCYHFAGARLKTGTFQMTTRFSQGDPSRFFRSKCVW